MSPPNTDLTQLSSGIRHVIWDWNGTLLDDAWLCVEIINAMLRRRGFPQVDLPDYRRKFGFPVVDYYRQLGLERGGDDFERLSAEFITEYQKRWKECRLQPSVMEALDSLSEQGLSQSVLSAGRQSSVEECVAHFGLRNRFVALVGLSNDFAHGKLEAGRRWVSSIGIPASRILLVGDTIHDFEVARGLGLHCLLFRHGHHDEERLSACGATLIENLPSVLQNLAGLSVQPSRDPLGPLLHSRAN